MTNEQVQAAAPQTDTSDEACAVACMIVSNPQGVMQKEGWKRRVNDLIRALRDERNELRKQRNDLVDQNSYADLRASGGIYPAAASRATPADPALDPATVEAAAKCVPTTWLDPLLSGPKRVGNTPFGAHEVETLLRSIVARIRALASGETK